MSHIRPELAVIFSDLAAARHSRLAGHSPHKSGGGQSCGRTQQEITNVMRIRSRWQRICRPLRQHFAIGSAGSPLSVRVPAAQPCR